MHFRKSEAEFQNVFLGELYLLCIFLVLLLQFSDFVHILCLIKDKEEEEE